MTRTDPIHPAHCSCRVCRPLGPTERRRAVIERRIALALLVLFWTFPGRWLAVALFHSLTR